MKTIIISIIITIILVIPSLLTDYQPVFTQFIIFYIFIIFISYYFSKAKYFFFSISILNLFYHLFYTYFQRNLEPWDVYNFFTHSSEVIESFFGMFTLFIKPLIISSIILLILWAISKVSIKTYHLKGKIKYPIFIFLLLININSIVGLKVIDATLNSISNPKINSKINETPLYPSRKSDTNIVLILGESMKYDAYVESKLKTLGLFYKKIYAGATNTDVSLPLLLNDITDPRELSLNNQKNLFRLAKKNGFTTTFNSIQSKKALQYIKPFLQTNRIDNYKSFETDERKPKYDFLLLDLLKKIDFSQKNFIVFQQIGQHSPYHYFNGEKSDDATLNYKKSVDYSFDLFEKIHNYLINTKKPFILIFTSDHGEFSGEGGKWGHNTFDKTIYEVPFFANIKLSNIRSHSDLSKQIIYFLGYKKENQNSTEAIINGTMQSREDGFIIKKF